MKQDNCTIYNTNFLHYIFHLADAFIQSDLQLTKQETYPLEQCGVKGLAQGPNSCASYRSHTRDRTTDLAGPSQVA